MKSLQFIEIKMINPLNYNPLAFDLLAFFSFTFSKTKITEP
jgi:hypothetical protein